MPKSTILVAEDDSAIRLVISQTLSASGYAVRTTASPEALRRWVREGQGDVVITDVYLDDDPIFDILPSMKLERPELPFIVMSGQNTILTAASASEHGAFDYLPKPFDIEVLVDMVSRALKSPVNSYSRIDRETRQAEKNAVLPLIGRSGTMQEIYRVVSRVMNTPLNVLLEGEVGTGKELTARAIHDLGQYSAHPFIVLDMDALTGQDFKTLVQDTKRAAQTTVYVEEVAYLSLSAQAQLMQAMRQMPEARFIVSTSHDLDQKVRDGDFRQDLFYKLNVVRLTLPSLRSRKEDIPDLAHAFLIKARDQGLGEKRLDQSAIDIFMAYQWPGNVRELENMLARLCALIPAPVILGKDVKSAMHGDLNAPAIKAEGVEFEFEQILARYVMPHLMAATPGEEHRIYQNTIDHLERPLIKLALSVTGGNKVRAASILGLNRNTLRTKMSTLDLNADGAE